jgi:hypothetical protein
MSARTERATGELIDQLEGTQLEILSLNRSATIRGIRATAA